MQNFTVTLNKSEILKLHNQLKKYRAPKPRNPYLLYFYKVKSTTISIFTSGKLLIQGNNPEAFYNSLVGKKTNLNIKAIAYKINDYIGCDEVGVGDYFGGMVTCAVYLKKSDEGALKRIGVCDSKRLLDSQMVVMMDEIVRVCDYECSVVTPKEYNQLVKRFSNTHIVKAYLHNQTISKLAKRLGLGESATVVMDQFATRTTYNAYFTKIGIAPYKVTHFETKAENKYLAVAAASIIARVEFLKQINRLSKQAHMRLLLGASNPKIIEQARNIYQIGGINKLSDFVKIDFATTKKATNT
ncbi:MAG: ribonuclease HIII [Mycoplasmataceae bacterium]|jgi:ribonuclease HIII|nr:ribonuclease HIII [Mycoplasmataceae bacterium]